MISRFVFVMALFFVSLLNTASAATYYSDTNGDGVAETITTGYSSIDVYNPVTRRSSSYAMGTTNFQINSFADTDGKPGNEIIVTMASEIRLVNNASGTQPSYPMGGTGYVIFGTADTDGSPGVEVIAGMSNEVRVLHNGASKISRSFTIPTNKYVYYGVAELNGIAGKEIVVLLNPNASSGGSVRVLRDYNSSSSDYSMPYALSVLNVIDTNGSPGDEIVLRNGSYLTVINDYRGTTRSYSFGTSAWNVVAYKNYDAYSGNEICVNDGSIYYSVVYDRTGFVGGGYGC